MRSSATRFTFAGVNSEEYDLVNFSNSPSGLSTDSFVGSRSIREDKIEGRDAPYFFAVERSPMSFSVKFGFYGDMTITEEILDEITSWLIQDTYQPLVFSDNPDKIYYVIFSGVSNFVHNGVKNGYFNLTARNLYPYPVMEDAETGSTVVTTTLDCTIVNPGKIDVIPNIDITISSSGNNTINIYNFSNGSELEITGAYNDVIEVDGFNKIVTNVTDDLQIRPSERWLTLVSGNNNIRITGDCTISFNFRGGTYS